MGKPDAVVSPLTTGFRVPCAVAELANLLLGQLDADVTPVRSLRRDGDVSVEATDDTAVATVAAVKSALEQAGSIGVIGADAEVRELKRVLSTAGIPAAGPDTPGERVVVLAASAAKGLEYDHVVVVEPSAIVEAEPRGMNRLYVALTRAVSRLHVVHFAPLPWRTGAEPVDAESRSGGPGSP